MPRLPLRVVRLEGRVHEPRDCSLKVAVVGLHVLVVTLKVLDQLDYAVWVHGG